MNLQEAAGSLQNFAFRLTRRLASILPGGKFAAFGSGAEQINAILIVNLDRQPHRLRRVLRELNRFRTSEGRPLTAMARRFVAVDARDGRAVAATSDVDPLYRMRGQLYVQPDARLEACFSADEPIRMTRQEVAVARSHIEVWKAIAAGADNFVLVLEDDVWFRPGARKAIDSAWHAALSRCKADAGPQFLYLSYADAGGTAERIDVCTELFRPVRGLWFLSGYVLSRTGANSLLRAMPVVGPVDMWVNYRFDELGALALSAPAILQRQDAVSDNSYSMLPYLARAGIVDASPCVLPDEKVRKGPVLAWTERSDSEGLAMALSMLGLRVRVFDGDEPAIQHEELLELLQIFDALVDAPLSGAALNELVVNPQSRFLVEMYADLAPVNLPTAQTVQLRKARVEGSSWKEICAHLALPEPIQEFPKGASRKHRVFRVGRPLVSWGGDVRGSFEGPPLDDSPWVLPPICAWRGAEPTLKRFVQMGVSVLHSELTSPAPSLPGMVETFPGNMASFTLDGLVHDQDGAHLVLDRSLDGSKRYRSGAFASMSCFGHGHFETEIRAASGPGIITGFFLHRSNPRQEIDIEFVGGDPFHMLVNVYFNPGDDGAAIGFGYRGAPCRVALGFDATKDFHRYAIDWGPGYILWSVDGKCVHERVGWDPTPIPHLPMRLHANLWVPRSTEFAGRIDDATLPASATFRNLSVHGLEAVSF